MKLKLLSLLLVFTCVSAQAGELVSPKATVEPRAGDDDWKFLLAVPGFMAGVEGDVGIDGVVSDIDLGFTDILPRIDMIWATRVETSKGRFGILGELIYLSMSDGVGTKTAVKKVDIRVDEYLADFTLRWRILEGEKGYVDALVGVRYTNIYQEVSLLANDQRIEEVAGEFTDEVASRLRDRLNERLSDEGFRTALTNAVTNRITGRLATVNGADADPTLPAAPLAAPGFGRLGTVIERLVHRRTEEVFAVASAELRQAAAAEEAAARATVATDEARFRARAAALRSRVNARIADAREDLEKEVEKSLKKNLNRRVARDDAWWDPYIGIRARYNFTPAIYVVGRGDIGGFGVGSDLMWQAEAAFGVQMTRSIFAELGYRALSFDYHKDGFLMDTTTHGVQLTTGITF